MQDAPSAGQGDGGIECVTWRQAKLMSLGTFAASCTFSIFLFALSRNQSPPDSPVGGNLQQVNINTPESEASRLREQLSKEYLNGMSSGTGRLQSGSDR